MLIHRKSWILVISVSVFLLLISPAINAHCKPWHPLHCISSSKQEIELDPEKEDNFSPPIEKNWKICNERSRGKVFTVYSTLTAKGDVTQGWYSVSPGSCDTITVNSLGDYLYFYAQAWNNNKIVARYLGNHSRCLHMSDPFRIEAKSCPDGYTTLPFMRETRMEGNNFLTTFR